MGRMNKLPAVRSLLVLSVPTFLLVLAAACPMACSNGSTDVAGPPTITGSDGGFSEGGSLDAAGDATQAMDATDATGPTSPDANDSSVAVPDAADSAPAEASSDASPSDGSVDAADAAACGAPSGSYTGSCNDCSVNAGVLTCNCQTGSGSTTMMSSIDLCACPDTTTIANAQGNLTCCGNPGGSYTSTCDECAVTAFVLACTCKTSSGGYLSSSISLCSCQAPMKISNSNGTLTCGS
jgi:hypothetical protein